VVSVEVIAPPSTASVPVNVLLPAKVCVPVVTIPAFEASASTAAIVTVSVDEFPVIVIPVLAVSVRVSVDESATGAVPDVVEIVVNEFDALAAPV
jgi:hypothetical protein